MYRCHYCGRILRELHFTCRRCGSVFCSDHHLPENHQCHPRYQGDPPPLHQYCENCGRELGGLSFRCNTCGLSLCEQCRLPENHTCTPTPVADETDRTHESRSYDTPTGTTTPLPLLECHYCGVRTSKISFCSSCGHEFCSIHKAREQHRCESPAVPYPQAPEKPTAAVKEQKSAPSHKTVIALFVLAAVLVCAACAWVVFFFPDGSKTPGHLGSAASGYGNSSPPAAPVPLRTISPVPSLTITQATVISTPATTIIPATTPGTGVGSSSRTLMYILRGTPGSIPLTPDPKVYATQKAYSPAYVCTRPMNNPSPCTPEEIHQYYLKYIDDPAEKSDLDALVRQIESRTPDQDDQARIAISLVQNIPYDFNKLYKVSGTGQTRYPYQVLYDNTGVCDEKSLLLAYLLRQLGYGVAVFQFDAENHMAAGIQSPSPYAYKNSGYAFVETTSPSIVTDSEGDYSGVGHLTSSPEIIPISHGNSFTTVSEEYGDARRFIQLTSMGPVLDSVHYTEWTGLVQKYGLKPGSSSEQGLVSAQVSLSGTQTSSGWSYQVQQETCDINLAHYCAGKGNCCEKDNLCYLPCSAGTWDPRRCVCVVTR